MSENNHEHVSERFRRLLALYRKPDGSEWGGQDLQNATGGAVTRFQAAQDRPGREHIFGGIIFLVGRFSGEGPWELDRGKAKRKAGRPKEGEIEAPGSTLARV